MRKLIIAVILVFFNAYFIYGQVQRGIVKTRGRMVNGNLVPGKTLPGVILEISTGATIISDEKGSFCFSVPPYDSFSLLKVKKNNYSLVDPDFLKRKFNYSGNTPFIVVLEDYNQLQADINAATRKVRSTLLAQLERCESEIEVLKAQNKLTEQEYQERLNKLYDDQSNSERLIEKMAVRYTSTDYDLLDNYNRQVQFCIENGQLQKADSLIRSKGNIESRVAQFHASKAANEKERAQFDSLERILNDSENITYLLYEDLICDMKKELQIYNARFKDCPEIYRQEYARIHYNIGILYFNQKDYNNSKIHLKEALDNYMVLVERNFALYESIVEDIRISLDYIK